MKDVSNHLFSSICAFLPAQLGTHTLAHKTKKLDFVENHGQPNICSCYSVRLRTRWIRVNLVFVGCSQGLNFELRPLQNVYISSTACLHSGRRVICHFDGFLDGKTANAGQTGKLKYFRPYMTSHDLPQEVIRTPTRAPTLILFISQSIN